MVFVRLDAVRPITCRQHYFLAVDLHAQMALSTFDIFFLDMEVHRRFVAEEVGPLYQVESHFDGKGAIRMVDEASGHGVFQPVERAVILVESQTDSHKQDSVDTHTWTRMSESEYTIWSASEGAIIAMFCLYVPKLDVEVVSQEKTADELEV